MPSRRRFLVGAAAVSAWIGAARVAASTAPGSGAPSEIPSSAGGEAPPRVRVLGVAQDGGVPQIGCRRACCAAARRDPAKARRVAALGVASPREGACFLVDATPDIRSQVDDLRSTSGAEPPPGRVAEAILLTHAHMGHYAGLVHLGREALAADAQPVHATPRMCDFLKGNKPWSRLVEWKHVDLRPIVPGSAIRLTPSISAEAVEAPHRDEDSDTIGWRLRGPRSALLYVPDTDAWERWESPLPSLLEEVDVALLDGTFFDAGDLPGRDMSQVPHPLIRRTMDLLEGRSPRRRARVLFTHLNHTNPALDPSSEAAAEIARRGFEVASEGMEFSL